MAIHRFFALSGSLVRLRKCSALIFDMDGVITDTESIHAQAEHATCRHFGLNAPLSDWEAFQGRTAEEIFAEIRSRYGGESSPTVQELVAHKTDEYLKLGAAGLPVVPGSVDFIRYARGKFRLIGLATSSNSRIQEAVFRQYGLAPLFDAVVTGDDLVHGKPHPDPYLKASARLGVSPNDCLVIEDSDNGIRSALAAGCLVAGISTSFGLGEIKDFGAHIGFAEYSKMKKVIDFVR